MFHKLSAARVDTLGAHCSCQPSHCMPLLYDLMAISSHPHSGASSVASFSSSLVSSVASGSTKTGTSHQFKTCSTSQGPDQQYKLIHRRSNVDMDDDVSRSSSALLSDNKSTIQYASKVFLVDLTNINCWPAGVTKTKMSAEALLQANVNAHKNGRTDVEKKMSIMSKVRSDSHMSFYWYIFCRSGRQVQHGVNSWRHLCLRTSICGGFYQLSISKAQWPPENTLSLSKMR